MTYDEYMNDNYILDSVIAIIVDGGIAVLTSNRHNNLRYVDTKLTKLKDLLECRRS